MADKIRVLLVDDHTVVRQGLCAMLQWYADFQIVGEAPDGESAIRLARELRPDVVLMDISMPKVDGLEATRTIHSEFPGIRIVGLSMYGGGDARSAEMIAAGASAYCTKSCDADLLLSAMRGETEGTCERPGP